MGHDKATLVLDGRPMAVRVAEALWEAGAREVVAIGGDAVALGSLGLAVVPDDEPGQGPFPATLTALRRSTAGVVAVLSCDLIAPDAGTIRALVVRLSDAPPGVLGAVPVVDDEPQWTHAAWRRGALGALEAARRDGVRSLKRAAADLPLALVAGLPREAFEDADEPRDLPGDG